MTAEMIATTPAAAATIVTPRGQHLDGWAQYYEYFHTLNADMQVPNSAARCLLACLPACLRVPGCPHKGGHPPRWMSPPPSASDPSQRYLPA